MKAGLVPCHHPGGAPVPCCCMPWRQVATGASGQGSKWPRTPLPTSPSRDTFPEPWGQDRRGDARGSCGSAGDEQAGWAAARGGNVCDQPKEQIPFSWSSMLSNKHRGVRRGLTGALVMMTKCRAPTPTLDPIRGGRCPLGRPSLAF